MPSAQTIGLIVFVFVQFLNVAGLFFDVVLYFINGEQITYIVWRHPSAGIPILALQLIGVLGLAIHFYCKG